jgi:hypothetical protein
MVSNCTQHAILPHHINTWLKNVGTVLLESTLSCPAEATVETQALQPPGSGAFVPPSLSPK